MATSEQAGLICEHGSNPMPQWGDRLEYNVLEYINIPDPDLNTPELSETDYSE